MIAEDAKKFNGSEGEFEVPFGLEDEFWQDPNEEHGDDDLGAVLTIKVSMSTRLLSVSRQIGAEARSFLQMTQANWT